MSLHLTKKEIQKGIKKAEQVFDEREIYKKELLKALDTFGYEKLPEEIKKTVPSDKSVLREKSWRKQPKVVKQVNLIGLTYAENSKIKEVFG